MKNDSKIVRGYLIGYSMNDINLIALEKSETDAVITNINVDEIQKVRMIIAKKNLKYT